MLNSETMLDGILTCGPIIPTVVAWVAFGRAHQRQGSRNLALTTLVIATLNAAFATRTFLHFYFHPSSPSLPPWKDPQILGLAMLGLSSPIVIILTLVVAGRENPNRVVVWMLLL